MTGRQPERVGRGGGIELIRPSAADQTERQARELIAASPGLTAAQKQIEQDHLTRHLSLGGAGQRTLDGYTRFLGPLRALGRNGAFGDAWDGDTLPIPVVVVLAYLYARAGEITHVTAGLIVQAVLWVHRNGRWPDQDQADALDTTGWENPAVNPAVKAHLAVRADGENRPDRTQCLALTTPSRRVGQRCRADNRSGDRCSQTTANADGLCVNHRNAEPVHPAEIAVELRRCQNFTIRGESLCDKHHGGHERCRADLDGFDSGDGRARCPFPAAPPVLCADHQHHPAKGSLTLDRRCRAGDIDEPCPNQAVATHLCRMHQAAEPVHPESQVGVLADEPVILPGTTKKAPALRLPDLEAACAYDPEPERLAQLAAVRDTLAPHGIEMWHLADLGPDDITFTDTDGTVTVQFQVPTRPSGGMPRPFPVLEDGAWLEARYVTDGATQDEIAAEVGCSTRAVSRALARHGIATRQPGQRPRPFPALGDGAWLEARYVTDGASQAEIAAEVGCSQGAVGAALARHGIPARRRRQIPALGDGAWLEARYVVAGATIEALAAEVGCSHATVSAALARHGIETRPAGRRCQIPVLEDGAWLEARYVTDGATQDEIAAEVGCSQGAVGAALARHGIETRPAGRRCPFPVLEDGAWLEARYVTDGASQAEIAAEVGCSQTAVRTALARHGIATRQPGQRRCPFPALEDGAWLEARYVTDGATQAEIAAEVGCSHTSVSEALARHGIEAPFRTRVLDASGGADCPVAAIRAVLANPHHPDPNRPFAHPYKSAKSLPGPYSAWVEARDSSILPVGFWLGRRGGELGQTQLAQLAVREIDGQRRVMFTVNPKHSKTGDNRELVLPPCTCAAEIITREPMPLTPEMQALIADQGDDPDGCRLERLVPKIAHRPALCVVCSLARWLAMRWQQPGPAVRCPDDGCGDAALDWIDAFLRSLTKRDRLHRIWPPLNSTSKQAREETWQNPDPFRSLDAGDISNIVRRRLERAGLAPSSSHGLKRGAVTGMTEAGMDLAEISEITGNEDLKVLEGYIADDVAERRRIEAGQRSLGVLWLPDDQDAFAVGGDTAAA